jgi:hypothetical protein
MGTALRHSWMTTYPMHYLDSATTTLCTKTYSSASISTPFAGSSRADRRNDGHLVAFFDHQAEVGSIYTINVDVT